MTPLNRGDYGPNVLEFFLEEEDPVQAFKDWLIEEASKNQIIPMREAARRLGISHKTLQNQIGRGLIWSEKREKTCQRGGTRVRYVNWKEVKKYNRLTMKEKFAWRREQRD